MPIKCSPCLFEFAAVGASVELSTWSNYTFSRRQCEWPVRAHRGGMAGRPGYRRCGSPTAVDAARRAQQPGVDTGRTDQAKRTAGFRPRSPETCQSPFGHFLPVEPPLQRTEMGRERPSVQQMQCVWCYQFGAIHHHLYARIRSTASTAAQ
jgi:hypothetical protein